MNSITRSFFAFVVVLALCFHFMFILIYSSPIHIKSPKINFLSHLYVYPFFDQNWELFVPAPNEQHMIFVRYKVGNKYSNWQDILSQEIMNQRENKVLGNEARVLLFSKAVIFELIKLNGSPSAIFKNAPTNIEFEVLKHEINQFLKSESNVAEMCEYEIMLTSLQHNHYNAYYFKNLLID